MAKRFLNFFFTFL